MPRSTRQFRNLPRAAIRAQPAITKTNQQLRFYSQPERPSKIYTFEEIRALTKSPSADKILIDTREPGELQATGTIPGSVNIPVTSKPDSFFITPEEFEDRFGFERPGKETEVVFYCKSGVRSRAAAGLARQAGWENVSEYSGSWLDWEKNGGESEKVR
ncbi:Rhodanese-like protein [Mollisia scopiformis]|uniref:Rhodanese-like protein n=1 Tax=Mollisia scopiformis TaxID=149040 RepID=A0A132BD17_MOLSC|nr:Rhodanese-like protein [Mollisia scopiformis]KUJ10320.1 Rhodanese-like protein [Mollisia scopiformis]